MAEHLNKDLILLTSLSYDNMKYGLLSKRVIINSEKQYIDNMSTSADQMAKVIEIVRVNLCIKQTVKFKGFLEAMEESDDLTLKGMAIKLGK